MEGQRHLERLTRAYLPDAAVCSVGPPGEVAQHAGAIAVLDLQARAWRTCCRGADGATARALLTQRRCECGTPGRAAARLAGGGAPERGAAGAAGAEPEVRRGRLRRACQAQR